MKKFLVLLVSMPLLHSCFHVYYAPNTANIPALSEKGELRLKGLYSSGADSDFKGGELQGSYALTNHIGVMLNFFAAGKSDNVTDYSAANSSHIEKGNGSYVEVGGGYFKPLNAKKHWIAEAYAGLGSGSVTNDYDGSDYAHTGVKKFFLQPSISYKSINVEAGFAAKLSLVSWNVKESRVSMSNGRANLDITTIRDHPNFVVFEPAIMIGAGSKNVKLHLGLSLSQYHQFNASTPSGISETTNGSIGISINLRSGKKAQQ